MTAGVIIATHNRREDLQRTLTRIEATVPAPAETIVCCDGCTDDTPEMVRTQFPGVILLENSTSLGSVASRKRLIEHAKSDVLFSFDDDSYPIEPDYFIKGLRLFSDMPRLGIASFPQVTDEFPETLQQKNFGPSQFVASYAASAAAFRRLAYSEVPGWDPAFRHAYEEPDLALQMTAAGWQVYHFTELTVRHHYSTTNRNEIRTHHRHARNEQWSLWMRCPFPQVVALSVFRVFRQGSYALKRGAGWLAREPLWWLSALAGLPHCLRTRRVVPWKAYLGWLRLFRTPIESEAEWKARFAR